MKVVVEMWHPGMLIAGNGPPELVWEEVGDSHLVGAENGHLVGAEVGHLVVAEDGQLVIGDGHL